MSCIVLAATLAAGCGSSRLAAKSTSSSGTAQGQTTTHTLSIGGKSREYRLFVPTTLATAKPAPLVVMIHGGFGTATQAERDYGWDAKASANGFIVAYPNGDGRAWNAGTCCGNPSRTNVDDVGFITAMVRDIQTAQRIDPKRIFVTGMSNGAMMAQRLACETNIFAAMASVAGAQMVPCNNAQPISVLHIHGSADTHVPIDGSPGTGLGKVPTHPPISESVAQWRNRDGCAPPTTSTKGSVTTTTASCPSGRAVTLIVVAGAGHQWPGSAKKPTRIRTRIGADPPSMALNATDVIWDFFAAHPRPA